MPHSEPTWLRAYGTDRDCAVQMGDELPVLGSRISAEIDTENTAESGRQRSPPGIAPEHGNEFGDTGFTDDLARDDVPFVSDTPRAIVEFPLVIVGANDEDKPAVPYGRLHEFRRSATKR